MRGPAEFFDLAGIILIASPLLYCNPTLLGGKRENLGGTWDVGSLLFGYLLYGGVGVGGVKRRRSEFI